MKYILHGTIVTFDNKEQVISEGYIGISHQSISFISKSKHEFPSTFRNIKIIYTDGYIYPGLIDLHNHLPFNFLPLWNIDKRFNSRYEWKDLDIYNRQIVAPSKLLANSRPLEVVIYAEVKALVGGTTSFGGLVYFNKEYDLWQLRNLETGNINGKQGPIYQHSLKLIKLQDFAQAETMMKEGRRYFLYHLAEGTSPSLHKEFEDLQKFNMITERFVGIHCTALSPNHLKIMGENNASLIWSPLSNFLLYGNTADIISAKKNNVIISLGSDWSVTGSKNLLWELKAADLLNKEHFQQVLSNKELVEMVTVNPAKSIGIDDKIGRLAPGYLADLIVFDKIAKNNHNDDPYLNLILSNEKDLKLVIVGGYPKYGRKDILLDLGISVNGIEDITKTKEQTLCLSESNTKKYEEEYDKSSFSDVKGNLEKALSDLSKDAERIYEKFRSIPKDMAKPLRLVLEGADDPQIYTRAKEYSFPSFLRESFGVGDFPAIKIDSLITSEDKDFFITLSNNPNIPSFFLKIKDYLRY